MLFPLALGLVSGKLFPKMNMQYDSNIESAKLTEIKVRQVRADQAPDFVDAYVEFCLVDGIPASEYALEYIAERMPWVAQEAAAESLR